MHRPTQELKHQKAARSKNKAMGGDHVFRKEIQISVHVLVNNLTKCFKNQLEAKDGKVSLAVMSV